MKRTEIELQFQLLQKNIISSLELADGLGKFKFDPWLRAEGGGGISSILESGQILEKGGVNFSAVHGPLHPGASKALGVDAQTFYACGVSIVLHPNNPMVPIIHMNVRYFETGNTYWFGGGIDLTPHYIVNQDTTLFHCELKNVCDAFSPNFYAEYKKWADDYFFIPHRNETRGIGGIFFDRLDAENTGLTKERLFEFVLAVGASFSPTYTYLMKKNFDRPYTEKNKKWQALRRGRYVEFNLVYDRGTKFGLETGGRTESILMSLPANAAWIYDFRPEPGSDEEYTLSMLRKGINWIEKT
jgi:coproporphyrinogen III oxidase